MVGTRLAGSFEILIWLSLGDAYHVTLNFRDPQPGQWELQLNTLPR